MYVFDELCIRIYNIKKVNVNIEQSIFPIYLVPICDDISQDSDQVFYIIERKEFSDVIENRIVLILKIEKY